MTISQNDMREIALAANIVWQNIGDDILQVAGGNSIPREEVIEVVVDAGRLLQELRSSTIEQKTIDAWEALSYEEQSKLLAEHAFKYEWYGY